MRGDLGRSFKTGRYLGEILRRAIADLGASTPWFRWAGSAMDAPWSLDTPHLSAIAAGESEGLSRTDDVPRTLGAVSTRDERRAVGNSAARWPGAPPASSPPGSWARPPSRSPLGTTIR